MDQTTKTKTLTDLNEALTKVGTMRPAGDRAYVQDRLRRVREAVKADPVDPTSPAPDPGGEQPEPPAPSAQVWTRPWRSDSMWSKPLPASPQLMPDSADRVAKLKATTGGKGPVLSQSKWGPPVVVAKADSPKYSIDPTYNSQPAVLTDVPIPLGAKPNGSPADSDAHLCVWDPASHRAWDFYDAYFEGGRWYAKAGWAYDTDDYNGICPEKGSSGQLLAAATSANLPLLGGLLRPEDFAGGAPLHRLAFCTPCRRGEHYYPATKHGSATGSCGISEGSLLQLDPAFNVDAYTSVPWQRYVLKCWQRCGAYHRDGGGGFTLYRENAVNRGSDPWPGVGMPGNDSYPSFPAGFPWDRIRVLAATVANN